MNFALLHWYIAQAATVVAPVIPATQPDDPISAAILALAGVNGLMLFDKVAFWVGKMRNGKNGTNGYATKEDFERLGTRIVDAVTELRIEIAKMSVTK